MKKLIIATKNEDKMKEFKAALEPLGFDCVSLNDLNMTQEIEEDGLTFFDNAYKKAKTIALQVNQTVIADDSGLIVQALPDELGVASKRFSTTATYEDNNALLLEKLQGVKDRSAYFIAQLVVYQPSGEFYTYQGRVYGTIAHDLKGTHGFGYDPLFYIETLGKRMSELTKEEKNQISHRGIAIQKLVEDLTHEVITL